MEEDISFNQKTTLCGKSIIRNIKTAKSKGFYIVMNYIGVERRYYESLENLNQIIEFCDEVNIYDNTYIFKEIIYFKAMF